MFSEELNKVMINKCGNYITSTNFFFIIVEDNYRPKMKFKMICNYIAAEIKLHSKGSSNTIDDTKRKEIVCSITSSI